MKDHILRNHKNDSKPFFILNDRKKWGVFKQKGPVFIEPSLLCSCRTNEFIILPR